MNRPSAPGAEPAHSDNLPPAATKPRRNSIYHQQDSWLSILRFCSHSTKLALAGLLVTPQHYTVMLELACAPSDRQLTIGQLARRLGVAHNTVVSSVNRLSAKGYVRREPSPDDRRQVRVRLTESGLEVLRAITAVDMQALKQVRNSVAKVFGIPTGP